jgi:putative CocE/NonD family hydrolase
MSETREGASTNSDAAWWQSDGRERPRPYKGIARTSRYLTMRDGVKIAVDIYLPRTLRATDRLPTVIHQTRYYRQMHFRWPLGWFIERVDPMRQAIRHLVKNGYAFVSVDARGSGASFGSRQMEWSPDEVKDGAEVVDWIIQQPWSNDLVGTTGVSYDGTAAEMLLVNQHPSIEAAQLRFSLFDIYPDILCPGGARNLFFIQTWSSLNDALDRNELASFARERMGRLPGMAIRGVAPVDEDATGSMLQDAVKAHESNYDIYRTSLEIEFRDDRTASGIAAAHFSPHAFSQEIEGSGAAIYSWSSWYDGAYTLSAIKRFLNIKTPGSRLILGPWDHGGQQNPDPLGDGTVRFDHTGEMLRFFDHHLKGLSTGIEHEKPIHYFTMGEEAWKATDTWPPPGFETTPLYLAEGHTLGRGKPPAGEGADTYQVDYSASSGPTSRWMTQVNVAQVKIGYPDRKQQDAKNLVYTSEPLERDTEVTGHPIVTLFVRSTAEDGQFFVYLEEVTENGDVHYVTEGVFRAIHRKVSQEPPLYEVPVPHHTFRRGDAMPLVPGEVAEITFDLQPVSYLFRKGHSIRVAIAGADKDNFALVPPLPPTIKVLRNQAHPSHITLPVLVK